MTTASERADRVVALSRAYRKLVGELRRTATTESRAGRLDANQTATIDSYCNEILASVDDVSLEADQAMMSEVDQSLTIIEGATTSLSAATDHILAVERVVATAQGLLTTVSQMTAFCGAPSLAAAQGIAAQIETLFGPTATADGD